MVREDTISPASVRAQYSATGVNDGLHRVVAGNDLGEMKRCQNGVACWGALRGLANHIQSHRGIFWVGAKLSERGHPSRSDGEWKRTYGL